MNIEKNNEITKSSDAWNVAQGYTQLKILKPLVETDKLVRIAIYGSESIEGTIQLREYNHIKTELRIEAIQRLIDTLKEIIENSKFACTKLDSSKKLDKLSTKIEELIKVLPAISKTVTDQRNNTTTIEIHEKHFNTCLTSLRQIKEAIPIPLNMNNLIFPSSEEIDIEKIKQELIHGG